MIKAFYSDPHYGHKNICMLSGRPFHSVDEMNQELIKRYNEIIGVDDTVLWCGDAFFCTVEKAQRIMASLNGHKILVLGNHDRGHGSMLNQGFDLVMDECFLNIAERTCRVKHYPYANNVMSNNKLEERYLDRRPPRIKGEILIHGHTHQKDKVRETSVHVGIDSWDYRPALMTEVEELIKKI